MLSAIAETGGARGARNQLGEAKKINAINKHLKSTAAELFLITQDNADTH